MQDASELNLLHRMKKNPFCIARNTNSMAILQVLMQHSNPDVRLAAICNELMNPLLLSQLALDVDHYVRYSVASHPLTGKRVLTQLAADEHPLVRRGVSENLNSYKGFC